MYLYFFSIIDFSDTKYKNFYTLLILILYSRIKLKMKVYHLNSCKLSIINTTKHFNDKVSDLFITEYKKKYLTSSI